MQHDQPYVLAVASHKGGTGRTTAVCALAWAFAEQGRRVAVVDANQVATLRLFAQDAERRRLFDRVDLVGSVAAARELGCDLVLVDSPPVIDDASLGAVDGVDGVVLTTLPDPLALQTIPGATQALARAKERDLRLELLGVFVSIFDAKDPLQAEMIGELRNALGELCLEPPIPWQREFAEWGLNPAPTVPAGPARDAFRRLANVLARAMRGAGDARTTPVEPPGSVRRPIEVSSEGSVIAQTVAVETPQAPPAATTGAVPAPTTHDRPPYVLAMASHKGGTGRTCLTLALAWAFGALGRRVLVVDCNRVKTLGLFTGDGIQEPFPNVRVGSGRKGEAGEFGAHLVLLDAPPVLDDESRAIFSRADGVILTTLADPLAFRTIPGATAALVEAKTATNQRLDLLGLCVNVFDARDPLQVEMLTDLQQRVGDLCLEPPVPWQREVADWGLTGGPLPDGPVRDAAIQLARAIGARIGLPVGDSERPVPDPTPSVRVEPPIAATVPEAVPVSEAVTERTALEAVTPAAELAPADAAGTGSLDAAHTAPSDDAAAGGVPPAAVAAPAVDRPASTISPQSATADAAPSKSPASVFKLGISHREAGALASTHAVALSRALGELGLRVLLVDARRRPNLGALLRSAPGEEFAPGVTIGNGTGDEVRDARADILLAVLDPFPDPRARALCRWLDGVLLGANCNTGAAEWLDEARRTVDGMRQARPRLALAGVSLCAFDGIEAIDPQAIRAVRKGFPALTLEPPIPADDLFFAWHTRRELRKPVPSPQVADAFRDQARVIALDAGFAPVEPDRTPPTTTPTVTAGVTSAIAAVTR